LVKFIFLQILVAFVIATAWLFLADKAILISAQQYENGDQMDPLFSEWGEVHESDQPGLGCIYWRGRKYSRFYWWSPNNFMGRNACPTIITVTRD